MAFKTPGDMLISFTGDRMVNLTTETVESATLSLEGIDDIKSSDGLASSVFSVSDSVLNN